MSSTNMRPDVKNNQANVLEFAIDGVLTGINTLLLGEIVSSSGTSGSFRYVVKPLINYIDSSNQTVIPNNINDVPCCDLVGNGAGVYTEFAAGDTVLLAAIQRDITAIKNNSWTQQRPSSYRKFSISDVIIVLRISNSVPTVKISILSTGITVDAGSNPVIVKGSKVSFMSSTGTTADLPVALMESGSPVASTLLFSES